MPVKKKKPPKLVDRSPDGNNTMPSFDGHHDDKLYPTRQMQEMKEHDMSSITDTSTHSYHDDSVCDETLSESRDSPNHSYPLRSGYISRSTPSPGSVQNSPQSARNDLKRRDIHQDEAPARQPFSSGALQSEKYKPTIQDNTNERYKPTVQDNTNEGYNPTIQDNNEPPPDIDYLTIIGLFLAALLIVVVGIYFTGEAESVTPDVDKPITIREQMLKNLTASLKDLLPFFPSQTKRTWATVGAGSKAVFKTETPPQPGIILLASSSSGIRTMKCLTQKLSEILTKTYGSSSPTVFNTGEYDKLNAKYLKLKIDETFQSGLGSTHVAILHNLEKVPGHAAMMFHAYCDNESAPFKDAIIIFTMVLPLTEKEILPEDEKHLQRYVEARLQEVWEDDIGYDNTMALKSRVANGIGIVREEEAQTLNNLNC